MLLLLHINMCHVTLCGECRVSTSFWKDPGQMLPPVVYYRLLQRPTPVKAVEAEPLFQLSVRAVFNGGPVRHDALRCLVGYEW